MGQPNEKEDPIQLLEKINSLEEKIRTENIASDKSFKLVKKIIDEYQNYKLKVDNLPKTKFGLPPMKKKPEVNANANSNGEKFDKNKIEEINRTFERINKWVKMAKTPYYHNFHYIFQKIKGGNKEEKSKTKRKKMSYVGSMKNLNDNYVNNYRARKQTDAARGPPINNENGDIVIKTKKLKKNNSFDNTSVMSNDNSSNKNNNNLFTDLADYTDNKIEEKIILFYLNNKSKFLERVLKGPPDSFRWISWCIINEIPLERDINIYKNYITKDLEKDNKDAIIRDIERTFSDKNINNKELREKETSLYNILKAFWNLDKEVGYCQGMNLIVGFLLLVSEGNELDVFYLLISNFSSTYKERKKYNYSFRGLFSEEFPLLYFLNFIFDILLEENIPEVKKHLDEMGITYDLWIGQWFQTLFTIVLPMNWCKRVWDCIYSDSIYFLVKFGIAFTRLIKDDILKNTEEIDIINFFKDLQKFSLCPENKFLEEKSDINSLILKANKIKLDPEEYIKQYKKKEENFDTFNLKMEKNEKISYLLERGNKDIVDHKARHRKTVLFRSIQEENVDSDDVIIVNPSQKIQPKIDKIENSIKNNEKNITYDAKNKKIKITIKKSTNIMESVKIFERKNGLTTEHLKSMEKKDKVKKVELSEGRNKINVDNNNNKNNSIEDKSNISNTPYKHEQVKIPKINSNTAQKEVNFNNIEKCQKFVNKKSNNEINYPQTESKNEQQKMNVINMDNFNKINLNQNLFENINKEQNKETNFNPSQKQEIGSINNFNNKNIANNNINNNININDNANQILNNKNNNQLINNINPVDYTKINNININNNLNGNKNNININNNVNNLNNINDNNFNNYINYNCNINVGNNLNNLNNIIPNANYNYYNNINYNINNNNAYSGKSFINYDYKVDNNNNNNTSSLNYQNLNNINYNMNNNSIDSGNIYNNNINKYYNVNLTTNNQLTNTGISYNYVPSQQPPQACKVIKITPPNNYINQNFNI